MAPLRLIIDPPGNGAWNMAVDEALLESAAEEGSGTLRFYQWQEPTLSLGYFQSLADRDQHAASRACPVVRRASGGGAILHDRELTYSLAIPQVGAAGAATLYSNVHEALISTLAEMGIYTALFQATAACQNGTKATPREPFLCFQRRTCVDVVLLGAKIAGSAQRRRRRAVLQHGSVLLARSDSAPELPGIRELAGLSVAPHELTERWTAHLQRRLKTEMGAGQLSSAEVTRSSQLLRERFADAGFLARR